MNFIKRVFKFLLRAKVWVPLLLLAAVIAGAAYMQKRSEANKGERYRTAAVDRGPVIQRISANGTLNPVTVVNVGTQVSGTVVKLYTDFNQPVKANQVLLELDPALIKANIGQLEAAMRSVEATMRLAESTLKRNTELVAKGFITPQALEQNLKELGNKNNGFEKLKAGVKSKWEKVLNTVQAEGGTDEQMKTFYSCLYRTVMFPNKLYEVDANDQIVHYSPYNGKILPGYMYGGTGFWDTFRVCIHCLIYCILP